MEEEYEDFYDEDCDCFDSTIIELKEQLRKEVKEEIQEKMKALEKENKELQSVKENWEEIKQKYENKINEVEREKQSILDNVKNEIYDATLKDLFENCTFFKQIYQVDCDYEKQPKCDKCDENRKLTVIDSYGREHKVDCKCAESKEIFFAKRNGRINIYVQKDAGKNNFMFKVKNKSDYEYGWEISKEDILEKFDKNKVKEYYNTYFTTIEEAQKYADYLNIIEA